MARRKSKDLDYYLSLPYRIEIIPSEEGGFVARIPELPGCMTQAETWEELGEMIEDAKRGWLELALESGQKIPVPKVKVAA